MHEHLLVFDMKVSKFNMALIDDRIVIMYWQKGEVEFKFSSN